MPEDNKPKAKWYSTLNARRKAWRVSNPVAHDATFAVVAIVVAASLAFWLGVFWR